MTLDAVRQLREGPAVLLGLGVGRGARRGLGSGPVVRGVVPGLLIARGPLVRVALADAVVGLAIVLPAVGSVAQAGESFAAAEDDVHGMAGAREPPLQGIRELHLVLYDQNLHPSGYPHTSPLSSPPTCIDSVYTLSV